MTPPSGSYVFIGNLTSSADKLKAVFVVGFALSVTLLKFRFLVNKEKKRESRPSSHDFF